MMNLKKSQDIFDISYCRCNAFYNHDGCECGGM